MKSAWVIPVVSVLGAAVAGGAVGILVGGKFREAPAPEECSCPECPSLGKAPDRESLEGFPVEDWVCYTTQEDFELMMWATGIDEAAYVYEDIMGEQQTELEWWREHCVYEKAVEHRNLEAAKRLRKWRKELRLKAAGRAVDEATSEKGP